MIATDNRLSTEMYNELVCNRKFEFSVYHSYYLVCHNNPELVPTALKVISFWNIL